ncbi:MAG: hypothetical protein HYZ75_08080 [Elusimicrobia bacterium]|nr:hypothetical protein [Elusimicrobiota bacterium]
MSEPMSTDRLLRHYEQGERAALETLARRLDDTEARLLEQAASAPERLRGRLEELAARLHAAKAETDKRADSFREELLSVEPSPDAFRARLVMLEMEHASRLRLAEEGLRLLGGELEEALLSARARVKGFCDEARAGLQSQVAPERLRLVEALAETSRRLAADEEELRRLREEAPRAAAAAAERVQHLERELGALKAHGAEEAHARRALEAALSAAKLQGEKTLRDAQERDDHAAAEWAAERDDLRRRLFAAERAADMSNQEQAQALRRELEKRGGAAEDLKRRLSDAEAQTQDAKAALDAARSDLKSMAETARSLAARVKGLEDERRHAKPSEGPEGLAAKTRENVLLRSQLEAAEREWQETLARQDAARMQEIFKLRAEVQKLRWQLVDLTGKKGPGTAGPS